MAGRCMPELRVAALLMSGLLMSGLLAGCGQKGPLYLPDQARDIVTRPAGSQAPAEQSPAPNSPQSPDSSAQPANPAPEVAPPEEDKDKKEPGANAPR